MSRIFSLLARLSGEMSATSTRPAREVAAEELESVGKSELFALAVSDLADRIEDRRRMAQLVVQRQAVQATEPLGLEHPGAAAWRKQREKEREEFQREYESSRDERFRATEADPRWVISHIRSGLKPEGVGGISKSEFDAFVEFMGDRYQDWYKRAVEVESEMYRRGDLLKVADSTLHRRVRQDFFVDPDDSELRGWSHYYNYIQKAATDAFVEEIKADYRLELTDDLLKSVFALGDGTKVSWAEATREQHHKRLAMLKRDIAGTGESAARHALAIQMIDSAEVNSLGEIK